MTERRFLVVYVTERGWAVGEKVVTLETLATFGHDAAGYHEARSYAKQLDRGEVRTP